jgi:Uma2 family endonuclease
MEVQSMSEATTETVLEPILDSESLYEVVKGRRVEKPPAGTFQALVASILSQKLGRHARTNGLGRVVSQMLFEIDQTGATKRSPDVAFVSYERWARNRKVNTEYRWDVIPDLAIEVVGLSHLAAEVNKKIGEYFKAKVRRVWVVYPIDRLVYVYESRKKVVILDVNDELDGGDLLPGFRLSLAELFEDGEDIEED